MPRYEIKKADRNSVLDVTIGSRWVKTTKKTRIVLEIVDLITTCGKKEIPSVVVRYEQNGQCNTLDVQYLLKTYRLKENENGN